ncbi:uncharacterized protein SOCE26_035430 [Sorangium cellulosum]|uniref:Uncharacterized protein n=1 Tax=Sorangium cellulosum TaxID=56 RepID=A0A2L0ES44_SORCE|nr:uncharacterized protein SOCE26_035430 [Sorangium cellulosum]
MGSPETCSWPTAATVNRVRLGAVRLLGFDYAAAHHSPTQVWLLDVRERRRGALRGRQMALAAGRELAIPGSTQISVVTFMYGGNSCTKEKSFSRTCFPSSLATSLNPANL